VTTLFARMQGALSGRYTVLEQLGVGGMATVFLAHDVRHARHVAVKVLQPQLASAIGATRFSREIEIAARLVHPHILPLHDSGEVEGLLYYVVPYAPQGSLRARLERERQLPIVEAVRIARQLAAALDYAHRQGVVHRDIKPENVLLHEGDVLLADFGIALAASAVDQERLTGTGVSVGTPAYMSPEQATGERRVDARSDIYSLACVVYEMLTGEPPFSGGSVQAVIARVLTERPLRVRAMRDTVPVALEDAVHQALAKVPADRPSSAAEFAAALAAGVAGGTPSTPAEPDRTYRPAPRRRFLTLRAGIAAGVMLLAALMLAIVLVPRTDRATPALTAQRLTATGDAWASALSPDGRRVAFLAANRSLILVQDLATGRLDTLVRARGLSPLGPQWSPDGSRLLYGGPHAVSYAHYTIAVDRDGDAPRLVTTSNMFLSFGADDTTWVGSYQAVIYLGSAPATFQLVGQDSAVGDGRLINLSDDVVFISRPTPSPDGSWIAYFAWDQHDRQSLRLVSRDGGRRHVLDPDLGRPNDIDDYEAPQWARDGRTLFYARPQGMGWSIWRVRLDPRSGARRGRPEPALERLPSGLSFDVTPEGASIVYSGGPTESQLHRMQRGPDGKLEHVVLTTGPWARVQPDLSPDGGRIAYVRRDLEGGADLFSIAIAGGQERRLTSSGGEKGGPAWSPDGRRLAFVGQDDSALVPMILELSSGTVQRVGRSASLTGFQPRWSPDGRFLVVERVDLRNATVIDLAANSERPLVHDDSLGWMFTGEFSPAGDQLVVGRHTPPTQGLWVVRFTDGKARPLRLDARTNTPLRWVDARTLYAIGDTGASIAGELDVVFRIDPTRPGASPVHALLPIGCANGAAISPDGSTIVCAVLQRASDVWRVPLRDR
jgi:serine/threonine-protein kinase